MSRADFDAQSESKYQRDQHDQMVCSIFGHLKQWKFAQNLAGNIYQSKFDFFAKYYLNPQFLSKDLLFGQSGEISKSGLTLLCRSAFDNF